MVEEVAHGLLVDHALQQMKLAYEIAEPGVQCRRQAGLRAREEDLDGFARVRVAWPTRVVDGGSHFLAPCEVLAKTIDRAPGDGDSGRGRLVLETLLLRGA